MDVDAYMGEIRIWPGSRCPTDWHFCDGTLLKVAEYQALFSLIGNIYGGDGATTFALPDLRGKAPIHQGQGPGLSNRTIGQVFGAETVTVSVDQMPSHSHYFMASTAAATSTTPGGSVLGNVSAAGYSLYSNEAAAGTPVVMDSSMLGQTGGATVHSNEMPSMALNMIIALAGVYPSQS